MGAADKMMSDYTTTTNRNIKSAISALADRHKTSEVTSKGIATTLRNASTAEGAFRVDFNDATDRTNILRYLGPNYEFRQVTVQNNAVIPGRTFMGMSIRGNITQYRLFKKS